MGNEEDLLQFICDKHKFSLWHDYFKLGTQEVVDRINYLKDEGNDFIYLTIAIEERVIGSMLFQLYAKLVPAISNLFLKRCSKTIGGYAGTPIQRIALPSWIQCGGWNSKPHIVPCENYIVPHNKRGVLSMCHNGKHEDNSIQFFVTLDAAPWMDYKYVAFG